jgi:hypothetical protein
MANIPPNGNAPSSPVANVARTTVDIGNFLVNDTDAFNRASKVAQAIIGFLSTILTEFAPGTGAALDVLAKLRVAPDAAVAITNATCVVQRVHDFTDPTERARITKTPQKLISRITLTVGQALDTVRFLDSMDIVNVGPLNASAMGKLSIINLVKNAFIVISSVFSIWDSAKTISAEKASSARAKLQDWTAKQPADVAQHITDNAAQYGEDVDANAFQAYKVEKYTKKVENSNFAIKKAWVSIAADIAKMAIIVLSSVALAFLISNTVSAVVLAVTALAAASLGLGKTLYSEFGHKNHQIPANGFKNI